MRAEGRRHALAETLGEGATVIHLSLAEDDEIALHRHAAEGLRIAGEAVLQHAAEVRHTVGQRLLGEQGDGHAVDIEGLRRQARTGHEDIAHHIIEPLDPVAAGTRLRPGRDHLPVLGQVEGDVEGAIRPGMVEHQYRIAGEVEGVVEPVGRLLLAHLPDGAVMIGDQGVAVAVPAGRLAAGMLPGPVSHIARGTRIVTEAQILDEIGGAVLCALPRTPQNVEHAAGALRLDGDIETVAAGMGEIEPHRVGRTGGRRLRQRGRGGCQGAGGRNQDWMKFHASVSPFSKRTDAPPAPAGCSDRRTAHNAYPSAWTTLGGAGPHEDGRHMTVSAEIETGGPRS